MSLDEPASSKEEAIAKEQQAQPFMSPDPHSAPAEEVAEPRSFLATFLLTCTFGQFGLRHFYIGDRKWGFIRLGLFVGGYLAMVIFSIFNQFILSVIGSLAVIAASIWAAVDFFYVYFAVKNDAYGRPLTATVNDRKWAKGIFWAMISVFVIITLTAVITLSTIENSIRNNPNGWRFNTNNQNVTPGPIINQ